jgi:peptidoglycan/xylan/chitin deacetylase (PgdA/CDA1 family)
VALTFDAGADRGFAEYILDVLLYAGVKASFGMTGIWAEQHPDLVQRMALEGHRLINHSYDHSSFTGFSTNRRPLSTAQRHAQLERTERIIAELTGASTLPLFRAPYGDTDSTVLRDLATAGYAYNILWTVDSRGWMGYSVGQIIDRCVRLAEPGAIYVFHVGASAKDGPALPIIIERLREAGYTFETVDEILFE